MTLYSEHQVDRAHTPFARTWGALFNEVLGLVKDAFVESTVAAVKLRFPMVAPVDALDALAFERSLEPGFNETEEQYRLRLKKAWTLWAWAGTKRGILKALEIAGYPNAIIFEHSDWPFTGRWWDFWVVLRPPFPWAGANADGVWDDPGNWDDGGPWAFDIPTPFLKHLCALIHKWAPKHAHLVNILLVWENELWDDPGNWDDGGNWQNKISNLEC